MSDDRVHLHSFNLWNPRLRVYECSCGAMLTEEVLEANSPYGSSMFRSRIRALQNLLYELWAVTNDVMVEGGLRRRVLEETRHVATGQDRERIEEELRGNNGSENP
jgi:hypothetical protein